MEKGSSTSRVTSSKTPMHSQQQTLLTPSTNDYNDNINDYVGDDVPILPIPSTTNTDGDCIDSKNANSTSNTDGDYDEKQFCSQSIDEITANSKTVHNKDSKHYTTRTINSCLVQKTHNSTAEGDDSSVLECQTWKGLVPSSTQESSEEFNNPAERNLSLGRNNINIGCDNDRFVKRCIREGFCNFDDCLETEKINSDKGIINPRLELDTSCGEKHDYECDVDNSDEDAVNNGECVTVSQADEKCLNDNEKSCKKKDIFSIASFSQMQKVDHFGDSLPFINFDVADSSDIVVEDSRNVPSTLQEDEKVKEGEVKKEKVREEVKEKKVKERIETVNKHSNSENIISRFFSNVSINSVSPSLGSSSELTNNDTTTTTNTTNTTTTTTTTTTNTNTTTNTTTTTTNTTASATSVPSLQDENGSYAHDLMIANSQNIIHNETEASVPVVKIILSKKCYKKKKVKYKFNSTVRDACPGYEILNTYTLEENKDSSSKSKNTINTKLIIRKNTCKDKISPANLCNRKICASTSDYDFDDSESCESISMKITRSTNTCHSSNSDRNSIADVVTDLDRTEITEPVVGRIENEVEKISKDGNLPGKLLLKPLKISLNRSRFLEAFHSEKGNKIKIINNVKKSNEYSSLSVTREVTESSEKGSDSKINSNVTKNLQQNKQIKSILDEEHKLSKSQQQGRKTHTIVDKICGKSDGILHDNLELINHLRNENIESQEHYSSFGPLTTSNDSVGVSSLNKDKYLASKCCSASDFVINSPKIATTSGYSEMSPSRDFELKLSPESPKVANSTLQVTPVVSVSKTGGHLEPAVKPTNGPGSQCSFSPPAKLKICISKPSPKSRKPKRPGDEEELSETENEVSNCENSLCSNEWFPLSDGIHYINNIYNDETSDSLSSISSSIFNSSSNSNSTITFKENLRPICVKKKLKKLTKYQVTKYKRLYVKYQPIHNLQKFEIKLHKLTGKSLLGVVATSGLTSMTHSNISYLLGILNKMKISTSSSCLYGKGSKFTTKTHPASKRNNFGLIVQGESYGK